MPSATLTSKGQLTLPKSIREHFNLDVGQRIEFVVADDGTVSVRPMTDDVSTLKSTLPPSTRRLTLSQIERVIRRRELHE